MKVWRTERSEIVKFSLTGKGISIVQMGTGFPFHVTSVYSGTTYNTNICGNELYSTTANCKTEAFTKQVKVQGIQKKMKNFYKSGQDYM